LWRFLSFSIAEWALALFLLILLAEVWVLRTLIRKQAA